MNEQDIAGQKQANQPQENLFNSYGDMKMNRRMFLQLMGFLLPVLSQRAFNLKRLFEWFLSRSQDPVSEPDPHKKPEEAFKELGDLLKILRDPENRAKLELGVNPPLTNTSSLRTLEKTGINSKEYPGYPLTIPDGHPLRGIGIMNQSAPWIITHAVPGESMDDPSVLQITNATQGEETLQGELPGSSFSLFVQNPSAGQEELAVTQIVYDKNNGIWSVTHVLSPNNNQLEITNSFSTQATFGSPVMAEVIINGKKQLVVIVAEDKYGLQNFGKPSAQLLFFNLEQAEENQALLAINLPDDHWFNGNDQIAVYEGESQSFIAVPLRNAQSEPRLDPNDPPEKTSIALYAPHENTQEPVIIDLQGEPTEIGWIKVNNQPMLIVASKYKARDKTVRGKLSFYNFQGNQINQPIEVLSPDGQEWFRFTNIALVYQSGKPFLLASGATDYMKDSLLVGIDLTNGKTDFSFLQNQIKYCHYGISALSTPNGLLITTAGYDENNNRGINVGYINENNDFVPLAGFPLSRPSLSLNRPAFAIDPTGQVALVVSIQQDDNKTTLHSFDITSHVSLSNPITGWFQFGGNSRLTRSSHQSRKTYLSLTINN